MKIDRESWRADSRRKKERGEGNRTERDERWGESNRKWKSALKREMERQRARRKGEG